MDDEFDRPARERRKFSEGRPPSRLYLTMVHYRWVKGPITGDGRVRGRWVPVVNYQNNSGWNQLTKSCRRFLLDRLRVSLSEKRGEKDDE